MRRNPLLIPEIKGLAQVSGLGFQRLFIYSLWFRDCSLVIRFYKFPNIWGAFTTLYGVLRTANGGFAVESQVSTLMDAKPEGGNSYELLNFSAERVSAIFGSSDVVQPSAVRTLVLIRAF